MNFLPLNCENGFLATFVIFHYRLSLQTSVPRHTDSVKTVELVRQFGRLYYEDREAALHALNNVEELKEVHSLKGKILFSVVVVG